MNRYKMEEIRKYNKAREGLSEFEIKALDKKEEREANIEKLAREIHAEEFSEEYDEQFDSIQDAKERSQGKNPMSQEYTDKVNAKRVSLGIAPLSDNGSPVDNASWELCLSKANDQIKDNEDR